MRGLPSTNTISLVLATIHSVQAQKPNLDESVPDEARFPISRGDNFTFQPAAGSLCQWAVAQYPRSGKQFFILDSQPACAPVTGNASTTLRLQFGDEIAPGNATLTVQCKEPSIWNFIINDDEPEQGSKTVLDSICHSGDLPSAKDGFGGGWQNRSHAGNQGESAGSTGPSGGSFLPGQQANRTHDTPTLTSATTSGLSNRASPISDLVSNATSNPGSNQAMDPSNSLTGEDPSGADSGLADNSIVAPTTVISGQPNSRTNDAEDPTPTGPDIPTPESEDNPSPGQVSQESPNAASLTADPTSNLRPTMGNSGSAVDENTDASATGGPPGPTAGPATSIPAEGAQASTTGAFPSSCVCTC